MGLLQENGPCFVAEDSRSTYLNPWSWNNEVNMLYLDQPTQVGLSYDVRTNCTYYPGMEDDEAGYEVVAANFSDGVPKVNLTHRVGTFSSQINTHTANSTKTAAHALWHFAQTWFFEFPYYQPVDDRISLWAESYGGHYGPGFFRFFQEQNDKIANGSSAERGARYLHLDTLGIVNGLIDMVVQWESMIDFPNNNVVFLPRWVFVMRLAMADTLTRTRQTYGLSVFNQSTLEQLRSDWHGPGGCKETLLDCQRALRSRNVDPVVPLSTVLRNDRNLSEICGSRDGSDMCYDAPAEAYLSQPTPRGWYDIGHPKADPFPPSTMYGYLTEAPVLSALGVPVNFSTHSSAVRSRFHATYDIVAGGFLDSIGFLLDHGVKVHLMYGDRDFACNWLGGERASLAVNYSRSNEFSDAGYTWLMTPGALSGLTRQVGNYSFTRVFQAGHEVPSYQPAAAYAIFMRATFGKDVASGTIAVTDEYATKGPRDAWWVKNVPPAMPQPRCNILVPGSCPAETWRRVLNGTAVVKDWFVVEGDGGGEEDAVPPDQGQEAIGEL